VEEVKVKAVKVKPQPAQDEQIKKELEYIDGKLFVLNGRLDSLSKLIDDNVRALSMKVAQIQIILRDSLDTINKDIRTTFTGMGALTLINTILLCVILYRSLTGF
jgi:hypothetical protein